MHYSKPNDTAISVWFGYLPKGSTGTALTLQKYLDEKKYSASAPDPDGSITFIDKMSCEYCGANTTRKRSRVSKYQMGNKLLDYVEEI